MPNLSIQLESDKTAFRPGDRVAGTVSWQLEEQPKQVELRLLWYTQGKGDEDAGLVERSRDEWRVTALGYPVVRQWLYSEGYLTDNF